jgi:hypothetical protein
LSRRAIRDTLFGVYGLNAEQRETLAAYWWRRAEGEMTSWVGFRHVLADLQAEGSPQAIIALAERAVSDEHRHALWCRDFAVHFGRDSANSEVTPRSEQPIEFRGASPAQNRLLRILLCCFTETVGCFILRHVRAVMTEPVFLQNNQRHLADELQHSRVGWGHLATLNAAQREFLREWSPRVLALLPVACCEGPELERPDLVPFGYFTPSVLRAAYDEALSEVILPGLEHLGLREAA